MIKSEPIVLSIHIFLIVEIFRPLPPLSAIVSIWLTPPLQQWSAFAITHPSPLPADVICEQPLTVMHEEKE